MLPAGARRKPGVSIAAVALANCLNANLLRRWVVTEERAQPAKSIQAAGTSASAVEQRTFIPLQLDPSPIAPAQSITIDISNPGSLPSMYRQ